VGWAFNICSRNFLFTTTLMVIPSRLFNLKLFGYPGKWKSTRQLSMPFLRSAKVLSPSSGHAPCVHFGNMYSPIFCTFKSAENPLESYNVLFGYIIIRLTKYSDCQSEIKSSRSYCICRAFNWFIAVWVDVTGLCSDLTFFSQSLRASITRNSIVPQQPRSSSIAIATAF